MKLTIAIGLLFSMSAFANDGFDCRSGHSPQGGKFCHYVISQCMNDDAAAAAKCAVEKYSSNVTWDAIRSVEAVHADFSQEYETVITFKVKNKKGVQTQIVTLEAHEGGHLPVALEIK